MQIRINLVVFFFKKSKEITISKKYLSKRRNLYFYVFGNSKIFVLFYFVLFIFFFLNMQNSRTRFVRWLAQLNSEPEVSGSKLPFFRSKIFEKHVTGLNSSNFELLSAKTPSTVDNHKRIAGCRKGISWWLCLKISANVLSIN